MGKELEESEVVLLFDTFDSGAQNLLTSVTLSKLDFTAIALNDNGYLPDEVSSIYSVFCGEFSGRPLYFNEIKVPKFWEIKATNSFGEVYDKNHLRAKIFYAKGAHARVVEAVDWYDDRGVVRYTDHYNKYGALWGRTTFNAKGQKVNKSYFDAESKECVVENFVTGDIIVNIGNQVFFFKSKVELAKYIIKTLELDDKRVIFNSLSYPYFVSQGLEQKGPGDILYWQEPTGAEIPGNMRGIIEGLANRAKKVFVSNRASYEKLISLGAPKSVVQPLGYVYDFKRASGHRGEVLICTNSDEIECITELVRGLSNIKFHIAAVTEMSAKLHAVGANSNVTLYPNVKTAIANDLFNECDIYLDINRQGEILDAVHRAFLNNMLILGFEDTLHNRDYIDPEYVAKSANWSYLAKIIKTVCENRSVWDDALEQQRSWALSEDAQAVRDILIG